MIKMIVSDIDGTIIGKSLKLSQNIKNCFKYLQKNNIETVLATGRMFSATIPVLEELEINSPVICYQGSLIKTSNGNILNQILLPRNLTFKIIEEIRQKKLHINLYTNDTLFVEKDNEIVQKYAKDRNIKYYLVKSFENISFEGVHKLLVIDDNPQKVSELICRLNRQFSEKAYITKSAPNYCEISDIKATKGCAIKFLSKYFNIDKSEILGIGDQSNDIDLLQNSGIRVAMGNATEQLKNMADFVCNSVEDDGFIQAIQKYVLEVQYE